MKLIIAVIQPHRLEAIKQALADVEVFRLTVMDVQGFGRQRGQTEVYRGHEFAVNLLRKVQLMIAVNEEFLEPTIDAIIRGGRTGASGEIGDGKIFVLPWKIASASALANAAAKRFNQITPRTGSSPSAALYIATRRQSKELSEDRPSAARCRDRPWA